MSDDGDWIDIDQLRQSLSGWSMEQELEIAAEVYGPEPKGHRAATPDLSDEDLVERFRSMLGFDVKWDQD